MVTIVTGFLFVISSGLLFNDRFRANLSLVVVAATIAIVSTYFLFEQVVNIAVTRAVQQSAPPNTQEIDNSKAEQDRLKAEQDRLNAERAKRQAQAAQAEVEDAAKRKADADRVRIEEERKQQAKLGAKLLKGEELRRLKNSSVDAFNSGDYRTAMNINNEIIRMTSDNSLKARMIQNNSCIMLELGDKDEAFRLLQQALAVDSNDPSVNRYARSFNSINTCR